MILMNYIAIEASGFSRILKVSTGLPILFETCPFLGTCRIFREHREKYFYLYRVQKS